MQFRLPRNVANKLSKYQQTMRSDYNLVDQSPINPKLRARIKQAILDDVDATQRRLQEAIESNNIYNLDKLIINSPVPPLVERGWTKSMKTKEKKKNLEIPEKNQDVKTEEVQKLDEFLKQSQVAKRRTSWRTRISQESEYLHNQGWLPFFFTFTAGDAYDDRKYVKTPDGRIHACWREVKGGNGAVRKIKVDPEYWEISFRECVVKDPYYVNSVVQKLHRECGKHLGYSRKQIRKMSESEHVRWCFVVEHGKSGVHHHLHGLVWVKALPRLYTRDPNFGKSSMRCTQRECLPMKHMWPWSAPDFSKFEYVRYRGDIWSHKYKHVGVWDPKRRQPYISKGLGAVAGYVAKYITEAETEFYHRVRVPHGYGHREVRDMVESESDEVLQQLVAFEIDNDVIMDRNGAGVAFSQIKQYAKDEIFARNAISMNKFDVVEAKETPYRNMVDSLEAEKIKKPWRMHGQELRNWLEVVIPGASDDQQIDGVLAMQFINEVIKQKYDRRFFAAPSLPGI